MSDVEIPIRVFIRRNVDGEVRVHEDGGFMCDGAPDTFDDYQWSDGNYGCDCNRYLFFQRAGADPELDDAECGETLYAVRIERADTGQEVYRDEQW